MPSIAPPLAVTMGEPGGVGPEITVKAWRALKESELSFFVIADPSLFTDCPVELIAGAGDAHDVFTNALPVLALKASVKATQGIASPETAGAVIDSIEHAVALAQSGEASGVVTNPIQKSALLASGFSFPGHTEFLEALTIDTPMTHGAARGAVMMLAGPDLRTVPVTVHQSVVEAAKSLRPDMIVRAAIITAEALQRDFAIASPRLAISGLNPHAGEAGAMGMEDQMIIAPAVEELHLRGIDVRGPLPADTMFHAEARARYDAALCILHDQALIPAKTLAFHDAVNVTLGLPIVRTSPDHGTALDIAGQDLARPDSLVAAIKLAANLSTQRRAAT